MPIADTLARWSPLRQRVLTAFLLGPLVLAAVLWIPTPGFALALGLVTLGAAWEWGQLGGLQRRDHRVGFLALMGLLLLLLWLLPWSRPWVMGAGALWWLIQVVHIARVREVPIESGIWAGELAAGLLVLGAPWAALVELHGASAQGPVLVLFLMMLIWSADSLAYFVGRRFGRTKLAPRVSPGKTREGVYGALAGAVLWGLIFGWARSLDLSGTLVVILLCGVTVAVSVVGDLYESLLKRRRGVKDSSHLLPGHGGMLDRVDSLTAAAPVFVLGLVLTGGLP
ncbi:MAG: phosphatidate cytidylyltransferase [Bdellovibrio bacteriovorus]